MPDRGDDRDAAIGDRAHDDFLVEAPQILDRSAAAGDDHQIGPGQRTAAVHGRKAAHRARHLLGRALPLHQHRPDQHLRRASIRQPVQDVADDRAGGGCNDADRARQEGQRLLALGREQSFARQRRLELFQQRHQRAFARQLHPVDHDLIFGSPGIGGELARGDHLHPVLRREGQALCPAFPHDAVDDGIIVLQAEIEMPRRRPLETGNLAAQPHMAEPVLHSALEHSRQFADAERRRVVACAFLG